MWLDIQSQRTSDLDAAQLTVMTLFQYMVGNTDWSAVTGRPNDRCCHNVAVFGQEGVDLNTVVPFDFDQTGLVNPPYAAPPDPSLGIRRVTDRKYRGLCEHNDELAGAIAIFNQKRPELEALFKRDDLPYPKDRERALKYIERFLRHDQRSPEAREEDRQRLPLNGVYCISDRSISSLLEYLRLRASVAATSSARASHRRAAGSFPFFR